MEQYITLRFVYGAYTPEEFKKAKTAFTGGQGVGFYEHKPGKESGEPRYSVAQVMVTPGDERDIHKLAGELVPTAHSYAELHLKGYFEGRNFVPVSTRRSKLHHRPGYVPFRPDPNLGMSEIMRLTIGLPRRIPTPE